MLPVKASTINTFKRRNYNLRDKKILIGADFCTLGIKIYLAASFEIFLNLSF